MLKRLHKHVARSESATSARDARFRNKPYGAAMERNATVGSCRNSNFNIQEGFKNSFESSFE